MKLSKGTVGKGSGLEDIAVVLQCIRLWSCVTERWHWVGEEVYGCVNVSSRP